MTNELLRERGLEFVGEVRLARLRTSAAPGARYVRMYGVTVWWGPTARAGRPSPIMTSSIPVYLNLLVLLKKAHLQTRLGYATAASGARHQRV